MTKQRIAFQGEPGANSHLAIEEVFPGAAIRVILPTAGVRARF